MPLQLATASEQIAGRLVTAIALGQFQPGDRLPSERELGELLKVSRATIRGAIQRLIGSRLIVVSR